MDHFRRLYAPLIAAAVSDGMPCAHVSFFSCANNVVRNMINYLVYIMFGPVYCCWFGVMGL